MLLNFNLLQKTSIPTKSDATHCYQMFHTFAVKDPLTVPIPCVNVPTSRSTSLQLLIGSILKVAWDLGPTVSVDERNCSMQGKFQYKTRCGKYKRILDGIQMDDIVNCQLGVYL